MGIVGSGVVILGATVAAAAVAFEVTYNEPGNPHGPVEFVYSLFWAVVAGGIAGALATGYVLWT